MKPRKGNRSNVGLEALGQLLMELHDFLRILAQENLSSTAVIKSGLEDLLQLYTKSSSSDEEYIYINTVTANNQQNAESQDKVFRKKETNRQQSQHSLVPQKSLPDFPPFKMIPEQKHLGVPKIKSPEGYYEEDEPYDTSVSEDGEAMSTSYKSYEEEESSEGKSAS
ncbi:Actin filament-associated protein 1-like 2 [Heterocephalus glaber]|uniref:Actin filament-associated protein 1-like 2 n=1 Tax=Heterocephalus glaber TaxID=10181 RepID=G5B2E9_HETGA|nr:Actin filament-associated protein 1-like 2 [Heterocephalus glaber]